MSAPTLVDDWGKPIRVADLTMPWTFRGGGSRQDIFRTMSGGFNGTPMPGFHGSLPVEDIWSITNYMVSLSGGPSDKGTPEAPYGELLRAVGTEEELDLERGAELFEAAPSTMFPIVGQIIEPGRNFYPSAVAVKAQAIYNSEEIAFRLTWHDMRAERTGQNAPDIAAPRWEDELPSSGSGQAGSESGDDFWGTGGDEGGSEDGDFWGTDEDEGGSNGAADDGGDFWGTEDEGSGDDGGDDFWGDADDGSTPTASGPVSEFSDAVALQFPVKMPDGVVKPYILFGDAQNPVELWFVDLAQSAASTFVARGSAAVTPGEDEPPAMVADYDQGEWSVIFKRKRKSRAAISFDENAFIPIAFSVWDGFNRERGNKRGLTAWYDLYLEPLAAPSAIGPMAKAGLGVLGLELLIIGFVRRKYGKGKK